MQNSEQKFFLHGMYSKDISFENPLAPYALEEGDEPHIHIGVDVEYKASERTPNLYEVVLSMMVHSHVQNHDDPNSQGKTMFLAEVRYGGVFEITNQDADLESLLYTECPKHLLPTIKRIIYDLIRDAGYPQLIIQDVDFENLYQEKKLAQTNDNNKSTSIN